MSDNVCIEILHCNQEPGIHVERWQSKEAETES